MDWLKRFCTSFEAEETDRDSTGLSPIILLLPNRLPPDRNASRSAFSLVELLLIVGILGVFAVIVIPRFNYGTAKQYKAEATAKKIVTDLRLTRSLAISNAANNAIGYQLQMILPTPFTGYKVVDNSPPPTTVASHAIDPDVAVTGAVIFRFEPLGSLLNGIDQQLTVSAAGRSFTITVLGVTGMTKCVEN